MRSFVKFKSGQQSGHHGNARKYGEIHYEREMKTWRPFRYCGVVASLCAMMLGSASAWSQEWLTGREFSVGMWDMCFFNETKNESSQICLNKRQLWQTSVIGLVLFGLAFGPLATILSMFGLFSTSLQKKIYYFNSAGEIYLICALSTLVALIVYSVGMEIENKMAGHSYGYGYGLGCGSTGFFFLGALCMCVDDVAQSASGTLCKCCDNGDVRV